MDEAESFSDGMQIYYALFEFNASFYYLLWAVLMPAFGYKPIGVLAVFTVVSIVLLAWFKRKSRLFELA